MWEKFLIARWQLFSDLFINSELGKMLHIGWNFRQGVRLVMLLDLGIDSSLPGCFVEFPFGDLEKICGLSESHLSGADHVNGMFEGFVLGELGSIYGYSLILKSSFWNSTI